MNEIIKKNGITYGIIMGSISVLVTTLIYVIDVNYFVSWWLGILSFTISIVLSCLLLSKTKKDLKGILTFKEAFTTFFISTLISLIIATTFSIILFNVIDPSLKETIKELTLKSMKSMMEKFGGRPEDISKALKQIQETDQFSVMSQLKGTLSYIVVYSIFGLILAAFFKTKTAHND